MNRGIATFFLVVAGIYSVPFIACADDKELSNDERIGIKIDTVERSDSYPNEFRMPGSTYPSAKDGEDFFAVILTIKHIRNVHVGMSDSDMASEEPFLLDKQGNKHKMSNMAFRGIDFKDGLTGDQYELIEGASGLILFIIPESTEPQSIHFIYPYWQSWKEKVVKYGEIVIDLSDQ